MPPPAAPGDRIAEGAEADIFQKAASRVSADRASDKLDNEANDRSGHFRLPFGPSGSNNAGPLSAEVWFRNAIS